MNTSESQKKVHLLMNSLGSMLQKKQALLQAYYGILLPDYPSLVDAGLTDEDGYFLVAGERVRLLQHRAVEKVKITLKSNPRLFFNTPEETNFVNLPNDELRRIRENMVYPNFIQAAINDTGQYLDAPQSRP